jgi:hypothetical protein
MHSAKIKRMRNVSDKNAQNIKTHCMLSSFSFPKIVPFIQIMWKNTVQPDRSEMAIYDACALHAG